MNEFTYTIETDKDLYPIQLSLRTILDKHSFDEIDKQSVIVCATELARNVLHHSESKGQFYCYIIQDIGIMMKIEDYGKGIHNLEGILKGEAITSGKGLGLGLTGAKKIMDHFFIHTSDYGTQIIAVKWKSQLTAIVKHNQQTR